MIGIKRAYDPSAPDDGRRVLVDRLWPRGMAREKAQVDEWLKDVAPSTALRTWFGHDPAKWDEFRERYRQELADHPGLMEKLKRMAEQDTVTLLFAAKDQEHNNAVVLRELLEGKRS